jgi:hypothetical protein
MTFGPVVAPFFARSEEVQFLLAYACKIERTEGELKIFNLRELITLSDF